MPDDTSREQIRQMWEERIRQAKDAKRAEIPRILLELAFASGKTWSVWDKRTRRVRRIEEVDPRYADRELYSVNLIREYREAQLGELSSDDDRPQLLVAQDGDTPDTVAHELNQAAGYAWRQEWDADNALRRARPYCVDNGVAAIRCRWNPDTGKVTDHHPLDPATGQPVPGGSPLLQEMEQSGTVNGGLPRFKPVREGATEWQAYSALQILPPPGCVHEDEFPWEVLLDVVLVDDQKAEYGDAAAGLQEDADIANAMGMTLGQEGSAGQTAHGRLRGHCWRFLCFQRPSKRWPEGRTAVVASNQYVLLDSSDSLDYRLPNGKPHSGVVYLHWWRRSDSFWSGSFVGALKDPQRIIDRRESQNLEIIDRGMPKVYGEDGSLIDTPSGQPMEFVGVKAGKTPPTVFAGLGPGDWMYKDLDHHAENLSHASTLSTLRLGENPQNVDTYSQLALLNENEAVKRSLIQIDHRAQIGTLETLGVQDIVRYWPDEKKIIVSGDDDQVRSTLFRKETVPSFFMVKVATGAPQPRSQGAELKKVDAVWQAAAESTVVTRDPEGWTDWYHRSIEAGSVQDLPEPAKDSQQEFARLENLLMREGQAMPVMDYDLLPVHLPEHREEMDRARAEVNWDLLALLQAHVESHVRQAQENAAKVAAEAGPAAAASEPVPAPAPSGPRQSASSAAPAPAPPLAPAV